jgi:hypothetical protein
MIYYIETDVIQSFIRVETRSLIFSSHEIEYFLFDKYFVILDLCNTI